MPSDEPVRIRFDRAMNQSSVAAAFSLEPSPAGALRWTSDRELLFEHTPFEAASRYRVVLGPGYRDSHGVANSLRHSWTFSTEPAPLLTDASPAQGAGDVDPAAYITLTFSRAMEPGSLARSISISPSISFSLRVDRAEARRAIVAPNSLLEPRAEYSLAVTQEARDVNGNRLGAGSLVTFSTGDIRPLRHWVGFVAEGTSPNDGEGLWIVDENRFPRRLVATPIDGFSWSPDGTRLLLRSTAGAWIDQPLGGSPTTLPGRGRWAAFLDRRLGYAFLDDGALRVLRPDGQVVQVASGVREATVGPNGRRIAFVVDGLAAKLETGGAVTGDVIDGYDVDLRTRYRLQVESGPVDGLTWSPDGLGLAYRLDSPEPQRRQVRVRSLKDGTTVTVAIGDVAAPAWQAGSRALFFLGRVGTPDGSQVKVFRTGASEPPRPLGEAQGMPAGPLRVRSFSPSPDGHQVAFIADVNGRAAAWQMNADGTGLAQLTEYDPVRFPFSCRDVSWTPT